MGEANPRFSESFTKAISTHAIFIVVMATIFIIFLIIVFANFIPTTEENTDTPLCWAKTINFCATFANSGEDGYETRPDDWDSNCGFEGGGPTEEECRQILQDEED